MVGYLQAINSPQLPQLISLENIDMALSSHEKHGLLFQRHVITSYIADSLSHLLLLYDNSSSDIDIDDDDEYRIGLLHAPPLSCDF